MTAPENDRTLDASSTMQAKHEDLQSLVQQAKAYMEAAMPQFLQDLRLCCLTESPSDNAQGLNEMAKLLATMLREVGMQTSIIEHTRGSAVVGTLDGDKTSGPTLLLLGHHDTVHPMGVAEARTRLEGERFYSPGTVDMKAGLLQGIYALKFLHQQHYRNFHRILFISVPDEEISTRYQADLLRQIAREQKPYVIGLEGARSIGNVVTRRKGCMHYQLTARGRAAHAGSSPESGRNAVVELAHQIVQAQQLTKWREGMTVNAGPIVGGSKANIVSDFAEIFFDMRFLHDEDRVDAEKYWHTLLENRLVPDIELTLQHQPDWMHPMAATDKSLYIAQQVQFIAEDILSTPFDPETRGGASDCCTTATEGCPSVDGLGAMGGGAHTSNEYVLLPPVPSRVALLSGLLASL